MALKLPEPPQWWIKYKPLRWVLAALVVFWVFGTLLPRWREESPPAEPQPAQTELPPVAEEARPAPAAESPPQAAAPEPPPVKPAAPKPVPVTPAAAPKPAMTTTAPATPAPPPPYPPSKPVAKAEAMPDPAARYTQVEAERVRFMDALRSYDSVETVAASLNQAGYKTEKSVIERKRPSNRYPPFRNDTLKVQGYKHASHEGVLTLEFFNDRLYQAYFVPAQPADYLGWLRSRGLKLPLKRTGFSTLSQGNLKVTTSIDFATSEVGRSMGGAAFVRWEDTRLAQQVQEWGPVR
jgi:hypothetical protein